MLSLLIGHRGVGKSSLLKRLQQNWPEELPKPKFIDLDREIEIRQSQSISDLFSNLGEAAFRKIEQDVFLKCLEENKNQPWICALGAGFLESDQFAGLPQGARVIWVRRRTDEDGRIFLDRPRLDHKMNPLQEYHSRFSSRQKRFRELCHEQLFLIEGQTELSSAENLIFFTKSESMHLSAPTGFKTRGSLSFLPENFKSKEGFTAFVQKRLLWGFKFFEVRSDLISLEQLQWVLECVPKENLLLSFRPNSLWDQAEVVDLDCEMDMASELNQKSSYENIFSKHESSTSLSLTIQSFEGSEFRKAGDHLKLAPKVDTFSELNLGHQWWLEDKDNRSFLPRSEEGRWLWYRQIFGPSMHLNFIRESEGTGLDQPLIAESNLQYWVDKGFAAVLGDPVLHSWTPEEHKGFFKKFGLPVVRIQISKEEFNQGTLEVLKNLGLRFAAVTSPLKEVAFHLCQKTSGGAKQFRAVNTLVLKDKIEGHNTDIEGAKALLAPYLSSAIAVWGGGGTKEMLRSLLPKAQFYSARSGLIDPSGTEVDSQLGSESDFQPEVLVWAVGANLADSIQYPPKSWKIHTILDLNYTENSPGRAVALEYKAKYISGEVMFKAQATAQREVWTKYLQNIDLNT